MNQSRSAGASSWILDLRGNRGGSIIAASYLAGRFGFEGLFATSRFRHGARIPYEALGTSLLGSDPLVVLVDRRSASASEVVAFALQDEGRAYVIGEQTAGAVVAATRIQLASGELQITVARVDVGRTNSVIDGTGVVPNRIVPGSAAGGADAQLEAAIRYLQRR